MSNEVRAYAKLVYTPTGGTAVTILARKGKPNPDSETVMLTQLDEDNHQIVEMGEEVITGKLNYELSEVYEFPKDIFDIMHGGRADHVPGVSISKGQATFSMHDRLDAADTPIYEHTDFACQVKVSMEAGISDFSQATITVTMLGSNRGTYKVRGVGAA